MHKKGSGAEPAKAEQPGKSQLPLRETLTFFVFQSLWLRRGRMAVVLLGIVFAVAFFTVLLGTETIMRGLQALAAGNNAGDAPPQQFQRWWILVALLIAAVGITNAVLMSITERIREIGTLKCLGARSLHIVEIFLFETLFLGLTGGFLGGLLGVAALLALFALKLGAELVLVFGFGDGLHLVGSAMLVALVVALIAAVVPVTLAARIEPAEAMRYDV